MATATATPAATKAAKRGPSGNDDRIAVAYQTGGQDGGRIDNGSAQVAPIWPTPIQVIGGCGEYSSGKTLFGLSIDPAHTLCYDNEGSSASYIGLGFERVDVALELLKLHPNGYRPIDRFKWWREDVRRRATPGRFTVLMVDPISEIETGLAEYVRENITDFGLTQSQLQKSSGLFWGVLKDYWESILDELRVRVQTFYYVAHMRDEYSGNSRTGRREPKGKETLAQLASLYLQFERKPNGTGAVPAVPSAVVLKSRLAHTAIVNGEVKIEPILPPRLPIATPAAIREYCLKPADYNKLKAAEKYVEPEMTEAEKLHLQAQTAERQAEAAQAELTRMQLIQKQAKEQAAAMAASPPKSSDQMGHRGIKVSTKTYDGAALEAKETREFELTVNEIRELRDRLFSNPQEWVAFAAQHGWSGKLGELEPATAQAVLFDLDGIAREQGAAEQPPFAGGQVAQANQPTRAAERAAERPAPAAESPPESPPSSPQKQQTPLTALQLNEIKLLSTQINWDSDARAVYLHDLGINSFRSLSSAQADELLAKLRRTAAGTNGGAPKN